jgi:predicted transcriptional regulator
MTKKAYRSHATPPRYVTALVSASTVEALDAIAASRGVARHAVACEAIETYVRENAELEPGA